MVIDIVSITMADNNGQLFFFTLFPAVLINIIDVFLYPDLFYIVTVGRYIKQPSFFEMEIASFDTPVFLYSIV